MSVKKLRDILNEEISVKGSPTKDALDKASVGLFRAAYHDYRDQKSDKNKYYLRGIQDALIVALGETKFNIMKQRIKKDYTRNKII